MRRPCRFRQYGCVDHLPGVHILWESTTHDREPLSGLAEYKGEHGWFQAVFDELQDDYEYPRRMVLYELTDDEVAYEWRAHKVWELKGSTKNVVTPTSHHHQQEPNRAWLSSTPSFLPIH